MNSGSFTSASTFPTKIFCHRDLVNDTIIGKIRPIHVQVNPTNKCCLSCSFCSCNNRDSSAEIDYKTLVKETENMARIGTKAITITGGGEPLCYENIDNYIRLIDTLGMSSALTTNGVLFNNMESLDFIDLLTWIRVSVSDDRDFDFKEIGGAVKHKTDWSFSYVLSSEIPRMDNIIKVIEYANENKFTHVRIVDDILNSNNARMEYIKTELEKVGIDTQKVIWQGRKNHSAGTEKCLISLLKPNLTPYGYYVGCCGVQFAQDIPCLDWPEKFSIGTSIVDIYNRQKYFDGRVCKRCYYSEYNNVLCSIQSASNLKHKDFV